MRNIITCASYGGSGSSAITDLLKEFDNIYSAGDYEFTIAHELDGISDLQYYLYDNNHRLNCDTAIFRFEKLIKRLDKNYSKYINEFDKISSLYIKEISTLCWNGYWEGHQQRYNALERAIYYKIPYRFQLFFNKFKKSNYEIVSSFKSSKITYSNPGNLFFDMTREYTQSLIENLKIPNGYQVEFVALDQLIPPNNIERYMNYFNNIKVIVVDRDPRDLYLLNKVYWKEGWIPSHNLEDYITWYRLTRKNYTNNDNVLYIKFEDLIYNYDNTLATIREFLFISEEKHIQKKKYFNPEKSIKNTKLYLREEGYEEDVKKIYNELKEFCYDKDNGDIL